VRREFGALIRAWIQFQERQLVQHFPFGISLCALCDLCGKIDFLLASSDIYAST
jgi:hypothetical protein